MKSFRQYKKEADSEINEEIVNKTYALSQNVQFNSTRQKINTISSSIHSLTQSIKTSDDVSKKCDLLAEAIEQTTRMLVIQSDLSMIIKNLNVGNILLADDLKAILKTEIEKLKRLR